MRMFRATSAAVVDMISDKIKAIDDFTPEQWIDNTKAWMGNHPEQVYIVTSVEGDKIIGFCAAFNLPGEYVLLSQYWFDEGHQYLLQEMTLRVATWAQSVGKHKIKVVGQSQGELMELGFRPHSVILVLELDKESEDDLIEQIVQRRITAQVAKANQLVIPQPEPAPGIGGGTGGSAA